MKYDFQNLKKLLPITYASMYAHKCIIPCDMHVIQIKLQYREPSISKAVLICIVVILTYTHVYILQRQFKMCLSIFDYN